MPVGSRQPIGSQGRMATPSSEKQDRENGLTSIPRRIHCAATQEGECRNAVSETDKIILDHFFDTLAEVAMAVAKRRAQETEG